MNLPHFLWFLKDIKVILQIFCTCKCTFGVGMPCSCVDVFPEKVGGIQVLEGLAPCSQTVGSLLRTPGQQKWLENNHRFVLMNSLQLKNALNYFWPDELNIFMVQQSRMLPGFFTVSRLWKKLRSYPKKWTRRRKRGNSNFFLPFWVGIHKTSYGHLAMKIMVGVP